MKQTRLLIADDEGLIALDIAEVAKEAGYEVVAIAQNGKEVLRLADTLRPDLFLLDIRMPELDGISCAKEIAKKGLGPVVLLTAFADTNLMKKAGDAGVYGYLLKPVSEQSLRAGLHIAVERYRDMQTLQQQKEKIASDLEGRKVVEKAKGLLMSRYQWDEDTAFTKLRDMAMKKGWKIEKVAERILYEMKKQ